MVFRMTHVTLVLIGTLLLFPFRGKRRLSVPAMDWLLAGGLAAAYVYFIIDVEEFVYRAFTPSPVDIALGVFTLALVLEATRRTIGWILPAIVGVTLVYAIIPGMLPGQLAHKGYDIERLVGHIYMTLEGIFGVPVGVSSTLIILFTLYGAILENTGAGKFFVDFAFSAMGQKPTGAGRTAVLTSFLLGGPSGSGVATTVTVGSIAYPILKKAGYDRDTAGAIFSAGGIGAVISPPVMGAASFLIAEFLRISYLEVITMSLVPTVLYYLGILLMIELDVKRLGIQVVEFSRRNLLRLSLDYWFHFTSLFAIVFFMVLDFSVEYSITLSMAVGAVFSWLRRDTRLTLTKCIAAFEEAGRQVLSVASTCAAAGIIIGVFTLTGLGLKVSGIIVDLAGSNLHLTLLYTAVILLVLGLALPVTASYIIAAVITVPAMTKLGVPDYAAHMFVFYYAVLSEVSPPVALSPVAAAALTGGNPWRTMMITWKYTLPTFLVPFMFTATPEGTGLLFKGTAGNIALSVTTAILAIIALVQGVSGYFWGKKAGKPERAMFIASGLLLFAAHWKTDLAGFTLFGGGLLTHSLRSRGKGR
jgi:TRAP transporter 4TM/12TM fusion protein